MLPTWPSSLASWAEWIRSTFGVVKLSSTQICEWFAKASSFSLNVLHNWRHTNSFIEEFAEIAYIINVYAQWNCDFNAQLWAGNLKKSHRESFGQPNNLLYEIVWFPSTALGLFKSCLLWESELWNQTTQASRIGRIWPALLWTMLFSCSVMSDSETPWTAALHASLSFTVSWSLLKLMSIEFWWCHPTILYSVVAFSSCL